MKGDWIIFCKQYAFRPRAVMGNMMDVVNTAELSHRNPILKLQQSDPHTPDDG
jgi:hypothetical protein